MELADRGHFGAGITFIDCEPLTDCLGLERLVAAAFNLHQADQLIQHLHDHHDQKSRLIILDNFESLLHLPVSQAGAAIDANTNQSQKCKKLVGQIAEFAAVVITSRELLQTDWELHYTLRALTPEEGLTLFNRVTKNGFSSEQEQLFLQRELLASLLGNNPLAIKLIAGTLFAGQDLQALKDELEQDFFAKISEQDLSLFANPNDRNIDRQRSLYGSVLYSYNTLSEQERQAFERLSLFPDGLDLKEFKKLSHAQADQQTSKLPVKKPIGEREIKALLDKSLLEHQHGHIKLQSIINRFAEQQFKRTASDDGKHSYYLSAFEYNAELTRLISTLNRTDRYAAQELFIANLNNLLKAIEYGADIICAGLTEEDYLVVVWQMFNVVNATNSNASMTLQLNKTLTLLSAQGANPQLLLALKIAILCSSYYAGEFDTAYNALQDLMPLQQLQQFPSKTMAEQFIIEFATGMYAMEGESLIALEGSIIHHRQNTTFYPEDLASLGFIYPELLAVVEPNLHTFEALMMQDKASITAVETAIDALHATAHLERVQLNYIRTRLMPLPQNQIELLVSVNPFTRGLKRLMSAFAAQQCLGHEDDPSKTIEQQQSIIDYFEQALPDLSHIKFYYMQGHYFYGCFLKQQQHDDYASIYQTGLALTIKHDYRYWQHKFKQLKHPQLGEYDAKDYPLPGNPDPTALVNSQIKWIKQNRKNADKKH